MMIGTDEEAHECALCVDAWVVDEEDVSQQASMSPNSSSGSIIAQREEAFISSVWLVCGDLRGGTA